MGILQKSKHIFVGPKVDEVNIRFRVLSQLSSPNEINSMLLNVIGCLSPDSFMPRALTTQQNTLI